MDSIAVLPASIYRTLTMLEEKLSVWDCVDTLCFLNNDRSDVYDPYFYISLDVYYDGELPPSEERLAQFDFAGAFETSPGRNKDRFLVRDIPVRLEYKCMSDIEAMLNSEPGALLRYDERISYMCYRLKNADVLYKKSNWIDGIREKLDSLPDSFWHALVDEARAKMEHYLSDLCAASELEDEYYFLISSAGFIRSACSALFAINKTFEPWGREMRKHVFRLKELPYSFRGYFDQFVRYEHDMPMAVRREIAEHLASHIVKMCMSNI
ncbi:hypothetical protein WKV44_02695 [Spirochaetia bacterium 38H-sp]|uniref:DUF4037 domain-containing protein n=1 Tax=Rarispira pelagica TaxID=3141764 RepID=A0ABU9UAC7_9SPIR